MKQNKFKTVQKNSFKIKYVQLLQLVNSNERQTEIAKRKHLSLAKQTTQSFARSMQSLKKPRFSNLRAASATESRRNV